MKIATSIIVIASFFITNSIIADEITENTVEFCDQQLIQASINCNNDTDLESCIRDYLSESECQVEIENESNVDICDKECAKDFITLLNDNSDDQNENILSLTEGE